MAKKRQFFKFDGETSNRQRGRIFIVKWLEEDEVKISTPFTDIDKAEFECRTNLEQGICSWVIQYNG